MSEIAMLRQSTLDGSRSTIEKGGEYQVGNWSKYQIAHGKGVTKQNDRNHSDNSRANARDRHNPPEYKSVLNEHYLPHGISVSDA
jgi:hypothetical protein